MNLCPQLTTYRSVTSEVNSKIRATRLQSSNQQNSYHYSYLQQTYGLLPQHGNAIVQKQCQIMASRAQYGEEVTRDIYAGLYIGNVDV